MLWFVMAKFVGCHDKPMIRGSWIIVDIHDIRVVASMCLAYRWFGSLGLTERFRISEKETTLTEEMMGISNVVCCKIVMAEIVHGMPLRGSWISPWCGLPYMVNPRSSTILTPWAIDGHRGYPRIHECVVRIPGINWKISEKETTPIVFCDRFTRL